MIRKVKQFFCKHELWPLKEEYVYVYPTYRQGSPELFKGIDIWTGGSPYGIVQYVFICPKCGYKIAADERLKTPLYEFAMELDWDRLDYFYEEGEKKGILPKKWNAKTYLSYL